MARYERDYGRDFGRWQQPGAGFGGMRSDGWEGSNWRNFPGEEGWLGEGYEGMPNSGFDRPFAGTDRDRGGMPSGRFGPPGGYGSDVRGGFGGDFRSRGGNYGAGAWDAGYGGRDAGYGGGWGQGPGGSGGRGQGRSAGRWNRTRASEIMTSDPQAVTPDTQISEVARSMRDLDVGIIPVIESEENRRLQGVITDRDIAVRAVAEGKEGTVKVSECMTQGVRSVNKNDSVREVMRLMREEQVRRVPVVDREGRLVGIIAQADLAVDYAGDDQDREEEVGSTVERISEPARPERARMAAEGRNRGRNQPMK